MSAQRGFTLIEILIVISIIALLSSLVLVAINKARGSAAEAIAKTEVSGLSSAADRYFEEESQYPGMETSKIDSSTNQFPLLFDALFGLRKPEGPGGRSAPYVQIEEKKVGVYDSDTDAYRPAEKAERQNPRIKKYLLDPWGNPYVYRCNKNVAKKEDWMHKDADIYSLGPNGEDDTVNEVENGDDLGNW